MTTTTPIPPALREALVSRIVQTVDETIDAGAMSVDDAIAFLDSLAVDIQVRRDGLEIDRARATVRTVSVR